VTRSGFVCLAGWTNVGKSTLLNRVVGEKVSAVAEGPQTTRNRIVGVRTLPGRGQLVLVDTPGFHAPRERMNRAMVETARRALHGVDVVAIVVDAARGLGRGDEEVARAARGAAATRVAVLNKIDALPRKDALLPLMRTVVETWGCVEAIPVSALTGEGCDRLVESFLERLPEGPPLFPADQFTDQPERLLVAEWIREKLLHHTRQELPHATAVFVERWTETDPGTLKIEATILVERPSQRAIVLGKGGSKIKTIGTEARLEVERLLDVRCTLLLHVEVRKDWRNEPRTLADLGLD
jgi:GTP-binding protein Era